MSGTEADRVARSRAAQRARDASARKQRDDEEQERRNVELREKIRREAVLVLSMMAERNYPGIEEIELPGRRGFWGQRETGRRKGAWQVAGYSTSCDGVLFQEPVYLVSNGKLAMRMDNSSDYMEYDIHSDIIGKGRRFLENVADGIEKFRTQLQSGGSPN